MSNVVDTTKTTVVSLRLPDYLLERIREEARKQAFYQRRCIQWVDLVRNILHQAFPVDDSEVEAVYGVAQCE